MIIYRINIIPLLSNTVFYKDYQYFLLKKWEMQRRNLTSLAASLYMRTYSRSRERACRRHRLVLRITFEYKLTYFNSLGEAVSSELGSCLVRNSTINSHGYNLRNSNDIHINYSEGKYGNQLQ